MTSLGWPLVQYCNKHIFLLGNNQPVTEKPKRLPSQQNFKEISKRELQELQYYDDIGTSTLYMIPVAMILFCSDVFSDVLLGISYLVSWEWRFAILTIAVVFLPGLMNLYYDLVQDRETAW